MNAFHFSEKINLIHSQSEAGILRMLQNARFFGSAAVETAVLKFHITHSDGLQQSASNSTGALESLPEREPKFL